MDTLLTGKKGSGKSYYAVYQIMKLKDKSKVLHNISGFKDGLTFQGECDRLGCTILDFFRDSFYNDKTPEGNPNPLKKDEFSKYFGFLFVLDEAADLFPYGFKDQDVLKFFRMSRHYNIDIILITQDVEDLSKSISKKSELQLKAIPDLINPYPGMFLYHEMSGREKVGEIKLPKKKSYFDLYKSADYSKGGVRRKKRPMQLLLIFAVVATVLAGGSFFYMLKKRTAPPTEKETTSTEDYRQHRQNVAQNQNTSHSNQKNYQSSGSDQFPLSYIEKFDGIILPISTFSDHTGLYGILLDVPYLLTRFPFEVFKTRFGYAALVPLDFYEYYQSIVEKKKNDTQSDPNQPYYWHDQQQPTISSKPESLIAEG